MGVELTERHCPKCGASQTATIRRYFSTLRTPKVKEELLRGQLGYHKCDSCGFTLAFSYPIVYDDPSSNLLVFVCDDDRETLIDEFHSLLASCRNKHEMTKGEYDKALTRPFQIIVGLDTLARVVSTVDNGVFCYRSTPGLSEAPMFDRVILLVVAKEYRQAGRDGDAYEVIRQGAKFPCSDPGFFRELGAYALTAGFFEDAYEALRLSEKLAKERSHVWEQIVPSEGMITKIPEEVALPKLEARMKKIYRAMRPECLLTDEELVELAGTIVAWIERAIQELGDSQELSFYEGHTLLELGRLLKDKERKKRAKLRKTYIDAKRVINIH